MVYMFTLPGGWIADRVIGPQRAVLAGGILIASGHFSMAVPSLTTFYLGLVLIVIGTGLLKGNVSVIVGRLYAQDDPRRDAGFSIFYMGINTGAFVAPFVCGYLGQRVSWHVGFAAAVQRVAAWCSGSFSTHWAASTWVMRGFTPRIRVRLQRSRAKNRTRRAGSAPAPRS